MTHRINFPEKSVGRGKGIGRDKFVQFVIVSLSLDLCETRFFYTPTRSGSLSGRNL